MVWGVLTSLTPSFLIFVIFIFILILSFSIGVPCGCGCVWSKRGVRGSAKFKMENRGQPVLKLVLYCLDIAFDLRHSEIVFSS